MPVPVVAAALILAESAPPILDIVPPEPAVVPVPVMVRPFVPVFFKKMGVVDPPLAEMLRKVTPLPLITVSLMLSAAPVVVVSVLTIVVLFWVTAMLPPFVAVN